MSDNVCSKCESVDAATSVFGDHATAADQPTTEPSEVREAVARSLHAVDAEQVFLGDDAQQWDDCSQGYYLRRADAVLAALAPAPQPAADTERRSECGNPGPHDAHNFRNGGPEDGDYCYGLPSTETEVQWGVRDLSGGLELLPSKVVAEDFRRIYGGTLVSIREEA